MGREAPVTAAPSRLRTWSSRPGFAVLVVGLVLAAAGVLATASITFPTGLGVMLGLLMLYVLATYVVVSGIARMRSRAYADDPEEERHGLQAYDRPVWEGEPGGRSLRCATFGHREVFTARSGERPPHWRCRRCGKAASHHLDVGHPWMCLVVDHRYDAVLGEAGRPRSWRCRRCGHRRWTAPVSAGETLNATRAEQLWIKRGDDL